MNISNELISEILDWHARTKNYIKKLKTYRIYQFIKAP